jgi:transposase, IS30 family
MMHLNDITSLVKGQHLSLSERLEIQTYKRLDKSNRFIAKVLGRSHSTINDEIKRGSAVQKKLVNGKSFIWEAYYAETGQVVYEKHREACKPHYKLLKVERFIQYAKQKIQVEKWSPDIVVGRAIELGNYEPHERVCAKTLYAYIDAGLMELNNMDLWLKLQRNTKPKRDRERKRILGQSIDQRPLEINDRLSFGHWEIDTVVGKKTKGEPVVLTLTERLTRYQIILKIAGKNEAAVKETMERLSIGNPHFPKLFKSITADNGSEFASLSEALQGLSDVYFAHPYSSWERGTNEKHNGILRRFIPKGKSLKDYSNNQIKQITHWMNHLPRKILQYQTPTEAILIHFNQIQLT